MSDPAGVVDTTGGTASLEVSNRELIELSVRFSRSFLRWLDGAAGQLPYPRLRVLEVLHCQGPAMMKTLAEDVGLSARNLTTIADCLEHEGLIRRVPHPTDRRATLLELTSAGVSAAESSLAPRLADADDGPPDAGLGQERDVRCPRRPSGRPVGLLVGLRNDIDPRQEQGHRAAHLLGVPGVCSDGVPDACACDDGDAAPDEHPAVAPTAATAAISVATRAERAQSPRMRTMLPSSLDRLPGGRPRIVI